MMKHYGAMAVVVVAIAALAACGGDDTGTAPTAPTAETTAPTEPAITHTGAHPAGEPATGAGDDNGVLTVVLRDFAFDGLPASVPAGTKLAVENKSVAELHEIVALRVPDTETRPAEELVALPQEELLAAVDPNPATVLLAAPGGPQIDALGDGTLAEPGRYLIVCGIPMGVDPAEYLAASAEADGPPDVPGGSPHFLHGMFAELVVT